MSASTRTVQITLTVSRDVYERAALEAQAEELPIEELLTSLIAKEFNGRDGAREAFERASEAYRARLAREGKLDQSPDEVLEELRKVREQVARELYP